MNARPRVLLVDSNSDDRALAALVLRRELPDVEVEEVADGMVLADRLPVGGFAAVVTEYRLEWGDGLQVLETVKSLSPDCPVVLFASAGSETVAAHGLRHGLSAYVVKGSAGYVELPVTVRRVIERNAEQRASREGLALFQRLTEELALGTFAANADGRLTAANRALARIFGFESEETLIGRNLAEFLSDAALQAQVLASLSRGRTVRDLEAGVRRPEGGLAWVRIALWPVVDPVHGVVRFEGAVEDVTGHRKAERELSDRAAALGRSNVELQQFAYVISHDLQEPLQLISPIRAPARRERLATALDGEAASATLANMVQCADRMQVMINDVLAYARVDTQARPFEPVDFAEVVKRGDRQPESRDRRERGAGELGACCRCWPWTAPRWCSSSRT